jgi:hypothetical protein
MKPVRLIGPRQREFAKARIDMAPDGWLAVVKEPTRTGDQSAKFFAMIGDLRRQKPEGRDMSKEAWKAVVLSALGMEDETVEGFNGEPVTVAASSRRLTVRQMSDCLEIMFAYGATHGIVWSDPSCYDMAAA